MKPLRRAVWTGAILLLAGSAVPARAAWCNVFQVCCHRAGTVSASFYGPAPGCCDPCCPQPVCTTRYIQRCYYQPVTTYQTRSYYEPVTTYRTSYYYEPVTSYRYSCYYDPCSCSYQQVACPTTAYRLRSQCCPVQSWVQRCCSVPVTAYQQAFYYEPVTTCCTPTCCPAPVAPAVAAAPSPDCGAAPPAPVPSQPPLALPPGPGVTESRPPAGPGVTENPYRNGADQPPYNRSYPPPDAMPYSSGISYRQVPSRIPAPVRPVPPPAVRIDRIVAAPAGQIEGVLMSGRSVSWAGSQVVFISADRAAVRQTAGVDSYGRFRAALISGGWLVYVQGSDGRPVFQRRIDVRENETQTIRLVSR